MKADFWLHLGIMLLSVLIANFSQLLLKSSAGKTYERWYKQYLNAQVIGGYGLLGVSFLCSFFALRGDALPLSMAPIWNSIGYVFMTILAYVFLKERPSRRKLLGLLVIIVGIVLFSM